jgi:hypothetical protein
MYVCDLSSLTQTLNCSSDSDQAFPRVSTIECLIHVIRQQPKLAKDASSALVDLGEAIASNPSKDETAALLAGTLLQEVYARNSCLQALQVHFKLVCD